MVTTDPPTTDAAAAPLPAWHPLSDRLRVVKMVMLLGLLALGSCYLAWRLDGEHVDVLEMNIAPDLYAGSDVYLGNFRVMAIGAQSADLWSPWVEVRAHPIPSDLEVGQAVSLVGTFEGPGEVRADEWDIHVHQKTKKAIGVLSLVLVLSLAGWDLWCTRRRRA